MFSPKPLKNSYSDYSPWISAEIMELHYAKHYCGYVNNLNNALEKCPEFFKLSVPSILARINEIPQDVREIVRNNGGGVVNHEILWETLSTRVTKIHEGKLLEDIEHSFGTWENFENLFQKTALSLFGSGWVWLVLGNKKELKICATPNQDSPFLNGEFPIFGIDVWEHAYYLQYKNVRANYFKEIWKVIDWEVVEKRYLSSKPT